MKKYYLFVATALALAGCSSDEYLGETPQVTSENNAILFGAGTPNSIRANSVGYDAAWKLGGKFVVWGAKHISDEDGSAANDLLVYNNYQVSYGPNSAGTSGTNTNNWEYAGLLPYTALINAETDNKQTVKYWDYAAEKGYTFTAFSSTNVAYPGTSRDLVQVTKRLSDGTKYGKGYDVTIKAGAALDHLYFSDRLPIAKADYQKPVTLTFRNFGARVRVGFYETVPGYSVKIDRFYHVNQASASIGSGFASMTDQNTTNFKASLVNIDAGKNNAYTVTYSPASAELAENTVIVTSAAGAHYQPILTLGTGVLNTTLATEPASPTWDQASGAYTTVFPNTANATPMYIKVDYTLTSNDGSGETIHVKNARVIVPAQYVTWKNNYAYTYIFKISQKTNGTTGNPENSADPEGLYPITFDAIAANTVDATQETVTTVATNSITTYANGSEVTANQEYKAGETIYIVNTKDDGTLNRPTGVSNITDPNTGVAGVYSVTTTGDAISETTVTAKLLGAVNGINLTVSTPKATMTDKVLSADDTTLDFGAKGVVKFTPATAGTYAYVYVVQKYGAPAYVQVAGNEGFASNKTYYMKTDQDVYYPASGIDADNFGTNKNYLYTKTANGTAGKYDVKIITVK